jgi:hypothetical protein
MQRLTCSILYSCRHCETETLRTAMIPQHPCNCVLERDALLLKSSVGFVWRDCFAAIHGGFVPVPVHPPTFYPDAPHASTCSGKGSSYGKCCTGSGIYVLQLRRHLWFASVHGMSSPSHHFPGNPMRRPQQLKVVIIHWTCGHVYGDPSPTWGDRRCVCSPFHVQFCCPRGVLRVLLKLFLEFALWNNAV